MIDELVKLLRSNEVYPIPQTVYGYSDKFSDPPFANVLRFKRTATKDTGGLSFFVNTFDIQFTHKNWSELEKMELAIVLLLDNEQFTPLIFGTHYEGTDDTSDELYVYKLTSHWTVYENVPTVA